VQFRSGSQNKENRVKNYRSFFDRFNTPEQDYPKSNEIENYLKSMSYNGVQSFSFRNAGKS